jgi:hypothetical protein
MLRLWQIEEVFKLAEEGHKQRAIAEKTGLARKTIQRILSGERPDYQAEGYEVEHSLDVFTGPIARCPTCGGKVHMPCFACEVRAKKEVDKRVRDYRQLQQQGRVAPLSRLLATQFSKSTNP